MLGRVVRTVHLELLHRLLAHRRPHPAARVVRLAAVHVYAVPTPVGTIKRQPGIRRLLHAKAVGIGQRLGVRHTRRQQRERQIIAPVDRQVSHRILCQRVRLLGSLRFNQRRLCRHIQLQLRRGHVEMNIESRLLSHRKRQSLPLPRREAVLRRLHLIRTRHNKRQQIRPVGPCYRLKFRIRRAIRQRHADLRNARFARVLNNAPHTGGSFRLR